MKRILSAIIVAILCLSMFVPLLPEIRADSTVPTVAGASVNESSSSITLVGGAAIYLYGYGTGGGRPSGSFNYGQITSLTNQGGYLVAALAVTTSNTNSFSTYSVYPVIGGCGVNGFSSYTYTYGSNNSPAAPSASDSFTVTAPGSLVVVIAIGGDEQSLTVSGLPGLQSDASWPGSPWNSLQILHTYLDAGSYTVTEYTSQSAAGQTPAYAGDLIGVFVFKATSSDFVWIFPPAINGLTVDINGATSSSGVSYIRWTWGDGSSSTGGFPASHTYESSGNYVITVTSYYNDGTTASTSASVNVYSGELTGGDEFTINAGSGGSVSYVSTVGSGSIPSAGSKMLYLAFEDGAYLTANPSSGYSFSSWTASSGITGLNGASLDTTSPSISTVVSSDSSIIANFEATLSVSIGSTYQKVVRPGLAASPPLVAVASGGSGSYIDYTWYWAQSGSNNQGSQDTGSSSSYAFVPLSVGTYTIYVIVTDSNGAKAQSSNAIVTARLYMQEELDTHFEFSQGIASYGLYDYSNNFEAFTISTNEVMGYANIVSLNIPSSDSIVFDAKCSLQLNAMLYVTASSGTQVYWLQNAIQFGSQTYYGTPAVKFRFMDNVWNYTSPTSVVSSSGYSGGNGGIGKDNEYVYQCLPGGFDTPFIVYPSISDSVATDQDGVLISFSYVLPQQNGQQVTTFDTITLLVPNVKSASIVVVPSNTPDGNDHHSFDCEFVWGGPSEGEVTSFDNLDAYMGMYYKENGVFSPFSSVYSFGCDTGEGASNLQVSEVPNGYAQVTVGTQDNDEWLTNNFNPPLTLTTATTILGQSAEVDQGAITGVTVSISSTSVPDGTDVIVTSSEYGTTPPPGVGTIQLGDPDFYDVRVNSSIPLGTEATAVINITNPDFTAQNSAMSYWDGNGWVAVPSQFISPDTVCGNFSVSDLSGTPIMVTSSGTHAVTFDQFGLGSDYTGTVLIVDDASFNASVFPVSFIWLAGSVHAFAFQSPLIVGSGAKEYDWNSTSGLSALQSDSITVSGLGSVTGNYVTRVHDVGVTSVVANRTWIYQGWPVGVNVTIENNGDFNETVNVTLYYNMTPSGTVGTQTVPLLVGQSKTITFTWDTTSVQPHWYYNYTMTAVVSIPADFTPGDNTLADGNVTVRMMFDVIGNGKIDGRDITLVAKAFGSYGPNFLYTGSPPSPRWNPDLDFLRDNKIDGRDLTMIAKHFGQSYPP